MKQYAARISVLFTQSISLFFCIFTTLHLQNLYITLIYAYCVCVCMCVLVILRRVLTNCVGCSGWWSHEGLRASER